MFGLFDSDDLRDRPEVAQGKRQWRDGNTMRVESDEEYHARLAAEEEAARRLPADTEKALAAMRGELAYAEELGFDKLYVWFNSRELRVELNVTPPPVPAEERFDSLTELFRRSRWLDRLIHDGIFGDAFEGIPREAIEAARRLI